MRVFRWPFQSFEDGHEFHPPTGDIRRSWWNPAGPSPVNVYSMSSISLFDDPLAEP
jgi:hypothetical protein